ncbi:MAG: hypothetical protein EBZ50_07930 [Alphaproteobacteria bacterium]|nr:hypothetical protein [Alphaproteobacteria bacterium]
MRLHPRRLAQRRTPGARRARRCRRRTGPSRARRRAHDRRRRYRAEGRQGWLQSLRDPSCAS